MNEKEPTEGDWSNVGGYLRQGIVEVSQELGGQETAIDVINLSGDPMTNLIPDPNAWKYLENQFPGALFGLLCWDIVFMSKPGAFFNPYQLGPIDMFTAEFSQRRAPELQARFAAIRDQSDDWRQRLACTYAAKQGIAESGYRLIVNCNAKGGQEVYHLHLHLLGGRPLGSMVSRA